MKNEAEHYTSQSSDMQTAQSYYKQYKSADNSEYNLIQDLRGTLSPQFKLDL